MRKLIALAGYLAAAAIVLHAADPNYQVVNEIQIGGEGGWDYLIVDPDAHRLYVSHATKDRRRRHRYRQDRRRNSRHTRCARIRARVRISGAGSRATAARNSSTIVDLKTLKPLGTVPTGANPDSIRYLRSRKEVWTFNHTGGSITVFDPMSAKVIATIEVGGELEEAVEDPAVNRVYVNVEDKGTIAVVDTVKHAMVATWPIADCEGPTGLAFDARNHLLLSACDEKMAVIDSTSGKTVTSFPIAGRVDGNGFDPATGLAFASSGTGVLTIAHEDAPNKFTVVQTVKTQPTGRTMWLDPSTHRVYVPVAMTTPGPNGRAGIVTDTMRVLVLAEK